MNINQCVKVETYPLPNTEDLFATLTGAKLFTKLDLSHAYQQLELDNDTSQLTHTGGSTPTTGWHMESQVPR